MARTNFLARLAGTKGEAEDQGRIIAAAVEKALGERQPAPPAVQTPAEPPPIERYLSQEQDGWTRIWLLIDPEGRYQDVRWSGNTHGDAVTSHLAHYSMVMTDWLIAQGIRNIAALREQIENMAAAAAEYDDE